jgi:hypothetical protein
MRCKGISRDALVTASARDGRMRGVPVLRSAVHNVRGPRMRLRRGSAPSGRAVGARLPHRLHFDLNAVPAAAIVRV